jgi:hypothetical protein
MSERRTVQVSTYLQPEEAEQIRQVAQGYRRSVSNYVADVLLPMAAADAALLKRREEHPT